MPIMEWDAALDIGVDAMNAEHKRLLDIMNELFDKSKAGVEGMEINDLVSTLGAYTVEHFQHEEKFMEDTGYPETDMHKRLHANLLKKFATHAAAIKENNGHAPDEFFHFLKFWLSAHIKALDIKYAAHANQIAKAS